MTARHLFAALDVSLEKTTLCVMDRDGAILRELTAPSNSDAIAQALAEDLTDIVRLGLEAGPLSEWLARGLEAGGAPVVLMETRQVRAALSAMVVKTDRKDACGMAHLLRMGGSVRSM